MIILIDTEKNHDKIQHPFVIIYVQEARSKRKLTQHNKDYIKG